VVGNLAEAVIDLPVASEEPAAGKETPGEICGLDRMTMAGGNPNQ
jgi:hypothetical protein